MRLLAFFLPLGLALAGPAALPDPAAAPVPAAAPIPTLAARLADSAAAANHEKRQLAVTLFGATAVLSNGVLCGGIGPLTGCLGTPGTNSVNGTVRSTGGTVTGDDFSILFQIPTTNQNTGRVTATTTRTTSSDNGAGPMITGAAGGMALAAGVGAVALGLL